jgi:hypothetical protein
LELGNRGNDDSQPTDVFPYALGRDFVWNNINYSQDCVVDIPFL